jgi:NAD(P)H-nitrite reductase large subunit
MLPGANLKGVMQLRDYCSALALYDALQKTIGKTMLMIGGGYIGKEVAAAAATVGCKVRMIFPEDHLMPRLFTPEIASQYQGHYEAKGVELLMDGRICKEFLDAACACAAPTKRLSSRARLFSWASAPGPTPNSSPTSSGWTVVVEFLSIRP